MDPAKLKKIGSQRGFSLSELSREADTEVHDKPADRPGGKKVFILEKLVIGSDAAAESVQRNISVTLEFGKVSHISCEKWLDDVPSTGVDSDSKDY